MAHSKRSKKRKRGSARPRRQPGLEGTVVMRGSGTEVETAEGTFRLGARSRRCVMPGDRVYVGLERTRSGERRAFVEQAIEHAIVSMVGTFEPAGPLGVVRPLDMRIHQDFFVLPQDDSPRRLGVEPGEIVAARVVEYPTSASAGVVTLERRIGDAREPSLGIECVMTRFGLTDGYPAAAEEEAAALTVDVEEALRDPLRRDIRDRFLLTVDPVDARDFDDAISVERTPSGGWLLGVHIADVSHYVAWESTIDLEARRRSTSVYLADRVLPMLPERLCNDLCSLRPCEDRLAFTVDMELDAAGVVRAYEAYPSVIRSRARLSYDEAQALLEGADVELGAGMCDEQVTREELREVLRQADALANARREIRRRRGSIDFDMPEIHALLDEDGVPREIVTRERTAATSLVEEAMLLANECVAEFLSDRDIVTAYRVHENPSPDCLTAAVKTLTELGALEGGLATGIMVAEPRVISAAVADAAGTPMAPLVNTLLLRAMQRAVYKPQNEGHYALGARTYCHFTSPIRRYPDLLVHRVLKQALAKRELGKREAVARAPQLTGTGSQALDRIAPQLCRQASEAERVADSAAHASQKVKVAQYYAERIGGRDLGTVSWISDTGAYVRLDETGVEGLVRMGALGGEWWTYDEERRTLTGEETGEVIALGQRVVVEIASVNVLRGHLDLKLIHVSPALH